MNALVVGAGEMGQWLGDVLRTDVTGVESLAFADEDSAVAEEAAANLDARVQSSAGDAAADLVCIAVPIPAASTAIQTWAPAAQSAMLDVTGTMSGPIEAMRTHASDCARASVHPLFAPDNEPGNVAVVVDDAGPLVDRLLEAISARGNDLYETTATEHDEAMETVQAKAHAAILAYALAADPVPEALHTPVSAGLHDLVDQVTGGEARVYSDVQAAFDGADDVAAAARRLADADGPTFEGLYEDAGE